MNYKDLKKFEAYCKETGAPFTWEALKEWRLQNGLKSLM